MTSIALRQARTPVLIVGAGPAGLTAAIRLREQGIDLRIIDEQTADTKRTYPVLVHARTLRALDRLGVTAPLEWRGRAVTHLSIYTDGQRRAVLELPDAGQVAPGALTLPQDVLRLALMQRLAALGTQVEWTTRLVALEQDDRGVRASLVRRQRVEGAEPELRPEWLDVTASSLQAEYVIGADGCHSTVRELLGIAWHAQGERQAYFFYDAPDQRAGTEGQLVLTGSLGSSVYPLQGGLSRFSFQVGAGMPQSPGLTQLRQLLTSRLPWYAEEGPSFEWSGSAEFQPALASSFGVGRVWLAGDAAHSTGPLGAQSLNVGVHEGEELASRLVDALGRPGGTTFGPHYSQQRRVEWQRLFGHPPSGLSAPRSAEWVGRHLSALVAALPASSDDLDDLLDQLRVRLA